MYFSMNIKINIYYSDNGVGIVSDNILLKFLLKDYDTSSYVRNKTNEYRNADVGFHIQDFDFNLIHKNKINILIINEEWFPTTELNNLKYLDYIFVKSSYAKTILDVYHKNVINTGFFSLDRCFFPKHTKQILHFKGKSIQKNTEIIKSNKTVKIIDSNIDYLSENELVYQLNNHDIHICCSLYEAWGHYLWEAMSCGKLVICSEIPVFKEYLDPNLVKFISINNKINYNSEYEFLNTKQFKFRTGYFIDEQKLEELLNNKEQLFEFQKTNCSQIRHHFIEVNNKNKQKFLNIIKSIL